MVSRMPQPAVERFADMCGALGAGSRLKIMRLLLAAHPAGMVAGEIQEHFGCSGSTLSHHLDKLRVEGLVKVRRDGTFLWYSADTRALRELLAFLYAECCTKNPVVLLDDIVGPGRAETRLTEPVAKKGSENARKSRKRAGA
jgi:ArsR family transcriptional regulator, arsenate/arsenite/antimonite-responsive transcriptional repressor